MRLLTKNGLITTLITTQKEPTTYKDRNGQSDCIKGKNIIKKEGENTFRDRKNDDACQ